MLAGCLTVVLGAVGGGLAGVFGCVLAMLLAGAGHSHSDTFIVVECGFVGTIVGALTGPKIVATLSRVLESRRVARINGGGKSLPFPFGSVACLVGAGGAALGSASALYYGVAIAELSVENGGPVSTIDPVTRARLSVVLAAVLFFAAAFLLVRAVRGVDKHGR